MSFNLVQFDGAKFSVNAYTEAVEAEFAAELSIDHYIWQPLRQNFSRHSLMMIKMLTSHLMVTRQGGGQKKRSPNAFEYKFGNVYQANWYTRFLCDSVRENTYYLSQRDRYGEFRSLF